VSVTTRADLANGTIVDTLLLPAVVLPLLLRGRWPLGAAVALLAGAVVSGIPTFDQFRLVVAIPAAMLISFSVASRCDRGRALAGLALVLAGMVFAGATDKVVRDNGGLAGAIVFSFPLCLVAWGAGRAAWSRARLADQLTARTELLERQRELTAELAVEVERARLAGELDTAARERVRAMIELAVRAEKVLTLADDPERTRATFAQIERLGRASLNQMRELLGVLRGDERGPRAPRPTLADIDTLLDQARAGGRLVDLELHGERRPLPLGVQLATYRALQHALAAVGQAPDQPTTIRLRYLRDSFELVVSGIPSQDDGAPGAFAAARERILAQGGSFSSEDPPGRRVLRATLPAATAHG
jgi:signal transduction histidine kinase